MKTKTINTYQFDELSETAKKTARNWYRESSYGDSYIWDNLRDDAKTIGLEIQSLDNHRANKGMFTLSAMDCACKILKEHGEACDTYKDAMHYNKGREQICLDPSNMENGELNHRGELALEDLDLGFLSTLLEDYRINLNKEYEYQNSNESVDENIKCNEYEFSEDGKRSVIL